MPLTRDSILSANDRKTWTVEVPEWGGSVCVRQLSGSDRDRIEQHVAKARRPDGTVGDLAGLRALVVALAACDESGARLFAVDDVAALNEKSAAALDRVFDAAAGLNRMFSHGMEEARDDFPAGRS